MFFLFWFWRNLIKKDSFESAKYDIIFFTCTYRFWAFFHGSGSGFLADPDLDAGKKPQNGSGQFEAFYNLLLYPQTKGVNQKYSQFICH